MRGHERLIDMRRGGKAPRIVFLNDYPCATDWFDSPGDAVTVCTDGDVVQLLDLRFMVGLQVSISSGCETRTKALFDHCKAAGAAVVAACHVQPDVPAWKQDGWTAIWRKPAKVEA